MLKKYFLVLFLFPVLGFSQSNQTSKAIEIIKDLSYEKTGYNGSNCASDFGRLVPGISV